MFSFFSFSHFIFNFAEQLPSQPRSTALPSSIMDDDLQAIVEASGTDYPPGKITIQGYEYTRRNRLKKYTKYYCTHVRSGDSRAMEQCPFRMSETRFRVEDGLWRNGRRCDSSNGNAAILVLGFATGPRTSC